MFDQYNTFDLFDSLEYRRHNSYLYIRTPMSRSEREAYDLANSQRESECSKNWLFASYPWPCTTSSSYFCCPQTVGY